MKSISSFGLAFLAGMAIFAGLPLFGWGLGDVTGFLANPARVTFLVLISLLQIFALIYNPQVGRQQEDRKTGLPEHKLDLILIQIFSLAIVFLAPFFDRRAIGVLEFGNIFRFAGFGLIIPGFVLMQMAAKHLVGQFSIQVRLQAGHRLIQSGPYKWLRHPRYLGILLFFLGISMVFRSGLAILCALALFGVLVWRVLAEESLLQQEFGTDWEEYRARSWRIIPFLF